MAAQSSLRLSAMGDTLCCTILHPWSHSCFSFFLHVWPRSVVASFYQFALLHGASALIKMSKTGVHMDGLREYVSSTVRSTLYISVFISASLQMVCVVRSVMGSFNQWSIFVPVLLSATSILLEDRKRWNLLNFLTGNSLLERLLLLRERYTGNPLNPAYLTGLFMVGSAVVMYLLQYPNLRNLLRGSENTWFFYPPPLKESCQDDVPDVTRKQFKSAARLLAIGVALQAARVVAKNARHPAVMARRFAQLNPYRLGLFLGGHAALYTGGIWALRRLLGQNDAWHALPAGLLAGVAFRFSVDPNFATIPISVLTQILSKWFCKRTGVKNVSIWKVLFFGLSFGYLTHVYFTDEFYSPRWASNSIGSLSGNVAPKIRKLLMKLYHARRFYILQGGL